MTDTDNAAERKPMSAERLAWLRANNEPVGDHTSSLTADEVTELLDEVDRLRALSAELGDEWRVEWGKPGAPGYGIEKASSEGNARYLAGRSESARVQTRLAGRWRDADDTAATDTGKTQNPPEPCRYTAGWHVCKHPKGHDGDHRDHDNWEWMTHSGSWPDDMADQATKEAER